jgi:hypothetical protein
LIPLCCCSSSSSSSKVSITLKTESEWKTHPNKTSRSPKCIVQKISTGTHSFPKKL